MRWSSDVCNVVFLAKAHLQPLQCYTGKPSNVMNINSHLSNVYECRAMMDSLVVVVWQETKCLCHSNVVCDDDIHTAGKLNIHYLLCPNLHHHLLLLLLLLLYHLHHLHLLPAIRHCSGALMAGSFTRLQSRARHFTAL